MLGKKRKTENANSFIQFPKMTVLPPRLMHMDIGYGDDLFGVFHMFHMFVVSCLGVELKTVTAAHFANLLAPHLRKHCELLAFEKMITLIIQTHVSSY